jgi:hypothetical protein
MNISDYAYDYQGWDLNFLPLSSDDATELRDVIERDPDLNDVQRRELLSELNKITGNAESVG